MSSLPPAHPPLSSHPVKPRDSVLVPSTSPCLLQTGRARGVRRGRHRSSCGISAPSAAPSPVLPSSHPGSRQRQVKPCLPVSRTQRAWRPGNTVATRLRKEAKMRRALTQGKGGSTFPGDGDWERSKDNEKKMTTCGKKQLKAELTARASASLTPPRAALVPSVESPACAHAHAHARAHTCAHRLGAV